MPCFIILSEPGTGSTYLMSMLNAHSEIYCKDELLDDRYTSTEDPICDIDRQLSALSQPVVGFKSMPVQLINHKLTLPELVQRLNVKWVIVVWRKNCLEMHASYKTALRTKVWWTQTPSTDTDVVDVNGTTFMQHLTEMERRWKDVVQGWPPDVVPIFVKYEELVRNCTYEMRRILRCMSVDPSDYVLQVECCRQNPAPVSEKVSTWNELSETERTASVDIPSIVNDAISRELNIPSECVHLRPDREPPPPL